MSGKAQNMAGLASMLAATAVTKKVLDKVWRLGSGGKTPPNDPADPDVELREAVVWSVLSGIAVSMVRLAMARRMAAKERHDNRVAELVTGKRPRGDKAAKTLAP
ncbi:MAG: hypothetical protein AVDCRST_MAG36-1382 [uncultured Nocardioidaceae bacterium]|uniref:DUF4235 domain-containing protein n=1 Tax=uncultured Nocardioidaceae bacterium TaxID=253824 RepID=A0A6J4LTS4_9ACTN|nr:MAG: hypothetical protein AVDCRST_MAG36-1382 [uncultured Nocardioidaceae bacterium]